MAIPSPFHEKTSALCTSLKWKEWAGYYAVERYQFNHDQEYFAFRESAGLLDVSPLFKYEIRGKDALKLMNRVLCRDVGRMKDNQVAYSCWTDERGKVLDDGTVARFSPERFRLFSAHPSYYWLLQNAQRLDVEVQDITVQTGALALQGPRSRAILSQLADVDKLRYFHQIQTKVDGFDVVISRTGYTGDLGYELWVEAEHANKLYDAVWAAGKDYNILPAGILALDMVRVEAGFIMVDVDFRSCTYCVTDDQMSTPYEIGLGWTVHMDKGPFIGKAALEKEKRQGSAWSLVGLDISLEELEKLFDARALPLDLPCATWRGVVPLFDSLTNRQVGYATSGVWSPLLKRYIALATVQSRYAKLGTVMKMEALIDTDRRHVSARVVQKPFLDPARKKSVGSDVALVPALV